MYSFVEITKEYILSRTSQEEIFERYLGIPVEYKIMFKSPFREDRNPTCNFKKHQSGVITFKDWAGHFYGDCFNVVELIFNCSYYKALDRIAIDFNLKDGEVVEIIDFKKLSIPQEIRVIKIKKKAYKDSDLEYWNSFGISIKTLNNYKVVPVEYAWLDDKIIYSHKEKDPCYAYKFGKEYKLYFPMRTKYRFLNTYKGLQGYDQLPEWDDLIIITKSLKDVMLLNQFDISAIAPSSEACILTELEFEDISSRTDNLLSMYDCDRTGLHSMWQMRKIYGIKPVIFTNGKFGTKDYGGKDLTDIAKNKSVKEAEKQLNELLWLVMKMT